MLSCWVKVRYAPTKARNRKACTSARWAWLRQKSCRDISFTNNHISADTCNTTTASEEFSRPQKVNLLGSGCASHA
jgi:hypothetical protein